MARKEIDKEADRSANVVPTVKLLSLNARSVILKLDELQAEAIELKADIITVTEAWTQMLFYQLMDMNSR